MERVILEMSGMSCGHCVATVRKVLAGIDGVSAESVGVNLATLAFDPARTSVTAISKAIEDAGYPVVHATAAAAAREVRA